MYQVWDVHHICEGDIFRGEIVTDDLCDDIADPSDLAVDSGYTAKVVAELKVSEVTLDGGEVLAGSAVDDPSESPGIGEFPCVALSGGGVAYGLLDDELVSFAVWLPSRSSWLECPAHARELGSGIHEG